jgi:hypothetical protein
MITAANTPTERADGEGRRRGKNGDRRDLAEDGRE